MKCPICGKEFEPSCGFQKYCSYQCMHTAHNMHARGKFDYPPREPFEFDCGHCGKHVVTAPFNDKRSRFCSKKCEKRYWRHPPKNHGDNLGMSLNSLIRRERRDLD